jgi:hypothetical protein
MVFKEELITAEKLAQFCEDNAYIDVSANTPNYVERELLRDFMKTGNLYFRKNHYVTTNAIGEIHIDTYFIPIEQDGGIISGVEIKVSIAILGDFKSATVHLQNKDMIVR